MTVKNLHKYIIEATIITGAGSGETVYIPRIPLIPNDVPFEFKRLQFPVKPAFAMTINKSQGQWLNTTGIDLRTPVFGHGQLYVAMSRAESSKNVYILSDSMETSNVVFKQII